MNDVMRELYPTPVLFRDHADTAEMDAALAALVRESAATEQNFVGDSSNYGGYHSSSDFLLREASCVGRLRGLVEAAVDVYLERLLALELGTAPRRMRLRTWAWSVLMREGDANWPHVHPQATCSGVYYVEVPKLEPDERNGGVLVLEDPRAEAALLELSGRRTVTRVHPRQGLLVLFPSYLRHFVPPFHGPGERICIAFNTRVELPR